MFKNVSLLSLVVALAVAGVAFSGGKAAHIAMSDKMQAQVAASEAFRQWAKDYNNLVPVEKRWADEIHATNQVKDLYSIYSLLGKEPTTNPDTLIVDKVDRLVFNGVDLGANRVCLNSTGNAGVRFEESTFDELYKGIRVLTTRSDIQMRDVTFSAVNGKARAVVGEFCLLVQDEKKNGAAQ